MKRNQRDYLTAKKLIAVKAIRDCYIINEPGTGKQPGNSNVTVAYKGYLLMERF
jgi:hypothetical protein